MKPFILLLSLICFIPLNCQSNEPSKSPTQEQQSLEDLKYCKLGCENLFKIQCLKDTPIVSCVNKCEEMQTHTKEMDPKCWTALISCDELEVCRKN